MLSGVRPFPGAGITNIEIKFFPGVAMFGRDQTILRGNNVVKRLQTSETLRKAPPGVLRWKVVANTSAKFVPLSTQRNRLRRRWTAAIVDALANRGLGSDGKRLENWKDLPAQEIGGTLEVLVHGGEGFDDTPKVLGKKADRIVDALMRSGLGTMRMGENDLRTMSNKGTWNGR